MKITPFPVRPSQAEIITAPTKTTYNVGEIFDPSGMILKITHADGTVENITEFEFDTNLFVPFTINDTKQTFVVTVDGKGVVLNQGVTINGGPEPTYYTISANIYTDCINMFNSVSGSGTKLAGTTATFSASLKENYEFTGWYDSSDNLISINNPYSFIVDSNVNYYAKGREATITPDYLCFTAAENNCNFTCPQAFEYSLDNKITWNTASTTDPILLNSIGDKAYLRNGSVGIPSILGFGTFSMNGLIEASGNIMSLLDNNCTCLEIVGINSFKGLFANCSLVTAPELPATSLTKGCYCSMFLGCKSLTTAPELPAITLANECYSKMFSGCTALVTIPTLRATSLKLMCYYKMFSDCTSLQINDNPVVGIAEQAWILPSSGVCTSYIAGDMQTEDMFKNCIGIRQTDTPDLFNTQVIYYTQK